MTTRRLLLISIMQPWISTWALASGVMYFIAFSVVIPFGSLSDGTGKTQTTKVISASVKAFPIDLNDLGFGGTWEQFCDTNEIQELYPDFPEHDLIRMRLRICLYKTMMKELEEDDLVSIGAYKYCVAMKPLFDDFLMEFMNKLSSDNNQTMRTFLLNQLNLPKRTVCYNETVDAFYKTCVGKYNPCIKMFKLILARACEAPWLTTESILSYIAEICTGKWISDEIDWQAVFTSIKYDP